MNTKKQEPVPLKYRAAYREAIRQQWMATLLPTLYGFFSMPNQFESIDQDGEVVLNAPFRVSGLVFDSKDGKVIKDNSTYKLKDFKWDDSAKCLRLLYQAYYPKIGYVNAVLRFDMACPQAKYGVLSNDLFSFIDPITKVNECPVTVYGLLSVRIGGPSKLSA